MVVAVPGAFHEVEYCTPQRASRCTNAVACGWTLLTAPPSPSKATAPTPPLGPLRIRPARSMPRITIAITLGDIRSLKKSDLANDGTLGSMPLGLVLHCSTDLPPQPASISMASRYFCSFTECASVGCEPTRLISERMARLAPATLPSQVPPTLTVGVPPNGAIRCRFDQSSCGLFGYQDCQAPITRLALDHGHCKKNSTSELSSCVRSVNEVATPKLPPPPPLLAQSRSVLVLFVHLRTPPFAATGCRESTASGARPTWRASTPMPPPRARP